MQAKIIRIGNSVGVRLPSALVKQYDLKGDIEITPTDEGILIQPVKRKPRAGWEEQIQAAIQLHGSAEMDKEWEQTEWTW